MNTTHHHRQSPSRIERLLAHLAGHPNPSGTPSAQVDLLHDIHVEAVPRDR